MADGFVEGHTFTGETGLKTGANLDDLIKKASFAAGSDALDQTTLDDDGAGAARIKDGGVDTTQLADGCFSADATGLAKMEDGFLSADAGGRAKMADGFLSADATGRAKMANDFITADQLADDAVEVDQIADSTITNAKLVTRAGLPDGGDAFAFEVFASANHSIAKAAYTAVTLDSEQYDPGGAWASNKYTPGVKGYYMFAGSVNMLSIAAGKFVRAAIMVNGSVVAEGNAQKTAILDDPVSQVSKMIRLSSVTDYVQLAVYHDSASAKNARGGSRSWTYFTGFMAAAF